MKGFELAYAFLVSHFFFWRGIADEIFGLVLQLNLLVIKDRDFYRIWSPLPSWALIGKLYPFEYVLKEEVCATDLRRYIVGMISDLGKIGYLYRIF